MATKQLDSDWDEQTLANNETVTVEVDTKEADSVVVQIDNGTTDGAPSTYDLTVRLYSYEFDDWMFHSKEENETTLAWEDDARLPKMQYEVKNVSGSSATFRVRAVSMKE